MSQRCDQPACTVGAPVGVDRAPAPDRSVLAGGGHGSAAGSAIVRWSQGVRQVTYRKLRSYLERGWAARSIYEGRLGPWPTGPRRGETRAGPPHEPGKAEDADHTPAARLPGSPEARSLRP